MATSKKALLRVAMKEKRLLLYKRNPDAGDKVAALFFENFDLPSHMIVGAYWPIGSELDVRPLLRQLLEKGFRCALPRVTPQGLEFHLWTESMVLVEGSFQLLEPLPTSAAVTPHVLLVPLLSFDKRGHRLGYGQGHFDHYLHQHSVLTIGIGFKGQEIENIPHQPHDFALHYILTDQELFSRSDEEGDTIKTKFRKFLSSLFVSEKRKDHKKQ